MATKAAMQGRIFSNAGSTSTTRSPVSTGAAPGAANG